MAAPNPEPWTTWIVSGGAAAAIVAVLKAIDVAWTRIRGGSQDTWKAAAELREELKEAAAAWRAEANEEAAKKERAEDERDAAKLEAAELRELNKMLAAKVRRYQSELLELGREPSEVEEDSSARSAAELVKAVESPHD